MNFWVTVQKKKLNAKLENHIAIPHALRERERNLQMWPMF